LKLFIKNPQKGFQIVSQQGIEKREMQAEGTRKKLLQKSKSFSFGKILGFQPRNLFSQFHWFSKLILNSGE